MKDRNNDILSLLFVIILIISICSAIYNIFNDSSMFSFISNLILLLFSICFVIMGYKIKKRTVVYIGSILLLGFYICYIFTPNNNILNTNKKIINFSGKSYEEVVEFATKNNIQLNVYYEYSDMVEENYVISQSSLEGKKVSDIKVLDIAISDGPNPEKEVIIPNMKTWNTNQVIDFVNNNYLSNVVIDFDSSESTKDTVIDQSEIGSIKRNSKLIITFSEGEELDYDEISIKNLIGLNKFETYFYLEQNHLNYKFIEDYSDKYNRNITINQNIKAGDKVKINDKEVEITISKGKKIIMEDFTNKSINDITKWIISNHLRVEYINEANDTIEQGNIIKTDRKKGDLLTSRDLVKVYVSSGILVMEEFDDVLDFYEWAEVNNVDYEEEHEFSDTVKIGEIIKYSHKKGQKIKKGETVVVTISDGKTKKMINVVGLDKDKAIDKLRDNNINYDIVYKDSDKKNEVLEQSISSGSEVTESVTVTIVVGK